MGTHTSSKVTRGAPGRGGHRGRRLAASAWAIVAAACVFDGDDRCGPGQVYLEEDDVCVCAEGSVLDLETSTCVTCGDNETVVSGACVCAEGFSRAAANSPCVEIPEGLGASCDPTAATACSAPYDVCQAAADGSGYCTSGGCTTDDDCGPGYACDATGDPTVCLRPPTGQGDPCETSDDCAGKEASYCENLVINLCLVDGCAGDGGRCHGDHSCCDFDSLISGVSLCVPPEQMEGDACPFGGALVEEQN